MKIKGKKINCNDNSNIKSDLNTELKQIFKLFEKAIRIDSFLRLVSEQDLNAIAKIEKGIV